MNKGANTILYPVSDLTKAKAVFTALLGVAPTSDAPFYVGFSVAGQQIGLDPNGKNRGMTGATPFWEVEDIDAAIVALSAAGATVVEEAHEVGGGMVVAILKDTDGNMIGLGHSA
jgi:predicted enzyme related to lactoylglutathione lyase